MIREALLHFLFPHICSGCGTDVLPQESKLCIRCMAELPVTGFEKFHDNPVERKFWGRLPIEMASAAFYFTHESLIQRLIHLLKYKSNKEVGLQLGRLMGQYLKSSNRFDVDALVPLPLFPSREKKRGYNQARLLCEGISEIMPVSIIDKAVQRNEHTDTQTRMGRVERWQNISGKFVLSQPGMIENKHILLVDDVITTGATLEACGIELLKNSSTRLSIATLCFASN